MKPRILESNGHAFGAFVEFARSVERLCGIPGNNIVGVIQAFFDESGLEADCPYALFAGAVETPKAWDAMSTEWNTTLADKGIPDLHMVDAMNFDGHFKGWRDRQDERNDLISKLAFVFEKHIGHRVLFPHDTATLLSLPDKQQKKFGPLHYRLFEGCIKGLLEVADLKPTDVLHLFFDSSEGHSVECLKLYIKMRSRNAFLKSKCALLAFGEDELMPPLQAVDMLAYCEYQYLVNEGKPKEPLALWRHILHGNEGKRLNLNYDIRNEDAELGSGEIQILSGDEN